MSKVAAWKSKEVDELTKLFREYPVVGIVDMEGVPAKQLQKIRATLRGQVLIKMSKKSLIQHAIEKASKEEKSLQGLKDAIKGQPAIIFSKLNPFKLYRALEKSRASAPAKPNSIAPKDIAIQKGPTPFSPGPMLSELQQAGIPTMIAGGKISIKEDRVIVREGQKISPRLASILTRLGIEPMETGLNVLAAHEKGTVFLPETLAIDEAKIFSDIQEAYRRALNLSVNSGYITKETAPMAIAKAFMEAKALAIEASIFEPSVMGDILAKANFQMLSVASLLKEEALDEELKQKLKAKPSLQKTEVKAEKKEEKEEKEDKAADEKALEGLGSLFG